MILYMESLIRPLRGTPGLIKNHRKSLETCHAYMDGLELYIATAPAAVALSTPATGASTGN